MTVSIQLIFIDGTGHFEEIQKADAGRTQVLPASAFGTRWVLSVTVVAPRVTSLPKAKRCRNDSEVDGRGPLRGSSVTGPK